MSEIQIALVASKLRRTDYWVVVELQAAGIRRSPRFDPLTIEELERLVAHLKHKWRQEATVTRTNAKAVPTVAPKSSGSTAGIHGHGLVPLSPVEKRELALALLDIPDSLKASILGPKRQLSIGASELRRISKKKSSSLPAHAQVIDFLRSSEFTELQLQLHEEAQEAKARLAKFPGLGVAPRAENTHTPMESNPMAILERLPLDWWREQV